jgi:hypothetical protein
MLHGKNIKSNCQLVCDQKYTREGLAGHFAKYLDLRDHLKYRNLSNYSTALNAALSAIFICGH